MIKKRVCLCILILLISLVPLCSAEGELVSSVPVRFSFDNQTTSHIEFGFTRNAVSDMGTVVIETTDIELVETSTNSRKYTLPYELFAYWRLLAATDYTLSLRHTGYLDDADSTDPTDIIPFTLVCGSATIPANTDTVILSHSASVAPTVQSKPITVNSSSTDINASIYITTLTLILTAIE